MSQTDHEHVCLHRAATKNAKEASVPLKLRITPATRNLIDRAAELLGKTRAEFMLEASERHAQEVLFVGTVLRRGLRYETWLMPLPDDRHRYIFDFCLSVE